MEGNFCCEAHIFLIVLFGTIKQEPFVDEILSRCQQMFITDVIFRLFWSRLTRNKVLEIIKKVQTGKNAGSWDIFVVFAPIPSGL